MPTLTTNQKIAIALSVPVAGVLFYFLLKWAREDEELEDDTNNEEDFVSSSDLVSELQIPQCHVGVVIGRGGCVIKQIQKESETRINFKDDNEESGDELTDEAKPRSRTMVIRGSRERIKHAEVLIKKIIDEQPVMEKISVEIPQRVIGRIIGKGGKTIRQLCRISGAKLKIDSENETGDSRKCDIIGTQAQIECAKQLIDEKIAEDKEFRSRRKSTQEAKDKLTFAHLPVHGDYFGVYVSAIDTPGHFWVQNVTKDSKLLDNLVEQMTQFYGDRGLGHNLIPPKVGDLCCATFQHDESWYRGEIVQVMEDKSEVRIHYLDFGDTGVVSMANVKEIRKEYCDLPFHAVEVYLANVTPKGDKWSREACVAFEKLSSCAKWEVLMAKVMYYDDNGVPCIELIDTNTENDVNIEKELVDQGFAVYKEKISNPEIEDHSKASTSPFQTSGPVGDEVIAKEEEITVQHMNEQFQTPAFENARFNMDESELCSPITPSNEDISRVNDKDIVREPTIAPAEQKVVSCADISQLESLLGMLNVDESITNKEETGGLFENLIEESEVKEMDFEGTPLRTRDEMNDLSNADQYNSENLNQERGYETGEALLISEKLHEKQDGQENFEKDDPAANHLDRGEKVSELPVTSSVNLQQNFMEPITVSNVQFTESVPENDMVRNNGEKSVNGNLFNISFTNDRPVNPEYKLDHDLETDPKSTSTPNQDGDVDALDTVPEPADHTDYGLRRSCSEDLTNDDTLTDGGLSKSSSEMTISPHKDEECSRIDNKTPLSSRSLGSISSASPRGKRVLAANFGQIANNSKHESDDDSDGDSLYLSAKEDSDSTGFLSAVGSRSNLQLFDTDSDATPSGYLSEPDDDSMETIETTTVDDQERLDTTLLVEKLKQYADK